MPTEVRLNQFVIYNIISCSNMTFHRKYSPNFNKSKDQTYLRYSDNLVDWSGFYTQLSPQHSVRYLTKKWGDGAQFASLVGLRLKTPSISLLKVKHHMLASPKISGQTKARCIKKHLRLKYQKFSNLENQKLLEYMGLNNLLLSCVDAEEEEIIIPHNLLHSSNFMFKNLASFKKSSDGMLRTIGFRGQAEQQWTKMPSQYQFEPYLLISDKMFDKRWLQF